MFLQSRAGQRRQRWGREYWRWWWGAMLDPLMTLPVKVCRATSATVVRGPASHRERTLVPLPLRLLREDEEEEEKMIQIQGNYQNIKKSTRLTLGEGHHLSANYISDENRQLLLPGEVLSLRMKLVWATERLMKGDKKRKKERRKDSSSRASPPNAGRLLLRLER